MVALTMHSAAHRISHRVARAASAQPARQPPAPARLAAADGRSCPAAGAACGRHRAGDRCARHRGRSGPELRQPAGAAVAAHAVAAIRADVIASTAEAGLQQASRRTDAPGQRQRLLQRLQWRAHCRRRPAFPHADATIWNLYDTAGVCAVRPPALPAGKNWQPAMPKIHDQPHSAIAYPPVAGFGRRWHEHLPDLPHMHRFVPANAGSVIPKPNLAWARSPKSISAW